MKKIKRSGVKKEKVLRVMKKTDQWICWAYDRREWRNDKIPLDTNHYRPFRGEYKASSYKNENIWLGFDEAKELSQEKDPIDGIGFVVEGLNVSYLDLDDCVTQNMEVSDEIWDVIEEVDSYTELSPSGNGLHIYCKGDLETYGWTPDDHSESISAFDKSCVAVTEEHIEGTPRSVQGSSYRLRRISKKYELGTHGGW